jgi:hypothetical protein
MKGLKDLLNKYVEIKRIGKHGKFVVLNTNITTLEKEIDKLLTLHGVSSSYEGKESRPIKFSELELILIRYKIMIEEQPDRYTEAEFIQQEDFRRGLFK